MKTIINQARTRFVNSWGVTPQEFFKVVCAEAERLRTYGEVEVHNGLISLRQLAAWIAETTTDDFLYMWSPLRKLHLLPVGQEVRYTSPDGDTYRWVKVAPLKFRMVSHYSLQEELWEEQCFPLFAGIRQRTAAALDIDLSEAFHRAFDEVIDTMLYT